MFLAYMAYLHIDDCCVCAASDLDINLVALHSPLEVFLHNEFFS